MLEISETSAEDFPVAFAGFDEGGEFFELLPTYGGLGVERLEVVAEVAVNRACPESARFWSGRFFSLSIFSHQPEKNVFFLYASFFPLKNP